MDVQLLRSFFMWCTIINGALLALWTIVFMAMPGLVYRTQVAFFPIPRKTFDVVFYSFLAVFKILVLVFNVVPWLALLISV